MEIIGIILLIIFGLLGFSFLGWVLKGFGLVWDFLSEGCSTSFGCLIWVFLALIALAAVV